MPKSPNIEMRWLFAKTTRKGNVIPHNGDALQYGTLAHIIHCLFWNHEGYNAKIEHSVGMTMFKKSIDQLKCNIEHRKT